MKSTRPSNSQSRPTDCFISKAEVAARLGKTARTVEQWMQRGVIPYIKIGKGRRATVLFKWADIEAYLKTNYPLCNTQQDYSPPGRGRIVPCLFEDVSDGTGRCETRWAACFFLKRTYTPERTIAF